MDDAANTEFEPLRLVVELDDRDTFGCHAAPNRLYVIDGEGWVWEPVGCVVCIEKSGASETYSCATEPSRVQCLRCGDLVEVPYEQTRRWTVKIGPIERTGVETVKDSMLFPETMDKATLRELLIALLDEAEENVTEEDGSEW